MTEPETRARSPAVEPDVRPSVYAETVAASPYATQSLYASRSVYADADAATSVYGASTSVYAHTEKAVGESLYRLHTGSVYQRLRRRLQQVIMVIPARKQSSGLWWLPMQALWSCDPDKIGDEYDNQASTGSWIDFDKANAEHSQYLEKCQMGESEHAACVAAVIEGAEVQSVLEQDPELHELLGDAWDELLPEIRAFREHLERLPDDLEELIDTFPGTLSMRAIEWATNLPQGLSFTGQAVRARAKDYLSDPRFAAALLDAAVFEFAYCVPQGHELFAAISKVRGERNYFPHSPRQVLVFSRFGEGDEQLDGSVGLVGRYQIKKTEYWSNLATFDPPKQGVIGWRVHYMWPQGVEYTPTEAF